MTRGFLRVRLLAWGGIGLCLAAGSGLVAQGPQGQVPPLPDPINLTDDPLLKPFVWRSIGPANMGGRIDDIVAVESNPSIIYVGYATGGVWKSTNNGTTWTPIFDKYPVASIGDLALAPSNPDILYVGTGEPNNRQSSSFGAGVYKSTDAGKTFEYMGLKETQSIGRVVVHPKDPNIVYVAAVGHLFAPNAERGLYKTTDGGKTWTNTKFIDNDTGFIDVTMDAGNPNTLYAASYQRRRAPWGFNGGGSGSGIWKTTDAGKTWTKLTGNGLPDNPIVGRIGINVSRSKPGTIYASIEQGASGGTGAGVRDDGKPQEPGAGGFGGGRGRGADPNAPPPPPDPKRSGIWRSDDSGKSWRTVSNSMDRPMYYSKIWVDPSNSEIAYQGGAPFFKTTDGGKTWRPVQGIAHSDHHALWINPRNGNHLILGNDGGLDVSYDQAETWEFVNTKATGLFYAISADMRKPYYVCGGLQDNGSWCGPSATRSQNGILNSDWYRIGGGDGFYTQNDPTDWAIGYSESQDGNTNRYDLRTGQTRSIRPRAAPRPLQPGQTTPSPAAGGAAAAQPGQPPPATAPAQATQPAPEAMAQAPAQFGLGNITRANIVPAPPVGEQYRFYWNTPFILSPHNSSTVYLGGDRLFKSTDRGDTWTMTKDLTRNISRFERPILGVGGMEPMASKHDGAASYSNIVTIGESYVVPGVLWVGTNDGNVQVSRDGGFSWKNVAANAKGVPDETHVSRVEPSHFEAGTAYVTFDGHRTNDHKPYVFKTTDFGETFTSISSNLPEGNVNVIREDPKNRSLLYLGSEYAFYVSLDAGKEWKRFMNGLPTVRIDDVMVHPRDNDLILGTHGRSIWIIDDITPLQQLSADAMTKADAILFDVRPGVQWLTDMQKSITVGAAKHFRGQNPAQGTAISYWLKNPPAGDVKITISDVQGKEVRSMDGTKTAGLNRVQWNLTGNPLPGGGRGLGGFGGGGGRGGPPRGPSVAPGSYLVKLSVAGKEVGSKVVIVEGDEIK